MATKWSFISHFIYKHSHKISRGKKKKKSLNSCERHFVLRMLNYY